MADSEMNGLPYEVTKALDASMKIIEILNAHPEIAVPYGLARDLEQLRSSLNECHRLGFYGIHYL